MDLKVEMRRHPSGCRQDMCAKSGIRPQPQTALRIFLEDQTGDLFQIANELCALPLPLLAVRSTQDGRWMRRSHYMRRQFGWNERSPIPSNTEVFAQQRLRRAGPQTHQNLGLDHLQFRIQPGPTRLNFRVAGLFMNAPLPSLRRLPLEVLHPIRHIYFRPVNADFEKHFIPKAPRGSNERMPLPVFGISRWFPDKLNKSLRRPFTETVLGGVLPQITPLAASRRRLQAGNRQALGKIWPC